MVEDVSLTVETSNLGRKNIFDHDKQKPSDPSLVGPLVSSIDDLRILTFEPKMSSTWQNTFISFFPAIFSYPSWVFLKHNVHKPHEFNAYTSFIIEDYVIHF